MENKKTQIDHLYMHAPCKTCPFTTGFRGGALGRAKEIAEHPKHTCHSCDNKKQCAGHMIFNGMQNLFVALADFYNIPLDLKGQERVFKSKEDYLNHHKSSR